MGGVPFGPGSICTQPQACCLPDGGCADLDPLCCRELGGMPIAGTMCLGDLDNDGVDNACPCPCLGDLNGDGWLSANDVLLLVNQLLPYKTAYYWILALPNSCGDLDSNGWLSPDDVLLFVNQLLPYKSSYYWIPCP
jgi:hypothetical protein